MNNMGSNAPLMERVKWIAYGLVAGLILGMFLGWMFHALVGLVVRLVILIVILIPFIAAFLFWQKIKSNKRPADRGSSVRDADWREIDPRR
jgi:F0F1-type ATP synthase assembly protein I